MKTPRDLSNTPGALDPDIASWEQAIRHAIADAGQRPALPHQYDLLRVPRYLAATLFMRYARGDALEDLERHLHETYVPTLQRAAQLSAEFYPGHALAVHLENQNGWMLLAALACFDRDGALLRDPSRWFTHEDNTPLYAMVLRGLAPAYTYDGTYDPQRTPLDGDERLVRVLLQAPDTWQEGCAAFMRDWPKTMKARGYRERPVEGKAACPAFPTSLALVVCAFDIDDSSFRHLPFYPSELVDYYRRHRRPGRAAWRDPAQDLPEDVRPTPKKTYALSRSEAYARWLALAAGGEAERVRKALGRRKTMPALFTVAAALAAAGLAICADIKDDATVESQGRTLYAGRELPWPAGDGGTRAGPARITELLNAMDDASGARLQVLDDDGDNWIAVLVDAAAAAEFAELCEQLGVRRLVRDEWQ